MAPRDVEAQEPLLNGENAEACPSSCSWVLPCYYKKGRQSAGVPGLPASKNYVARLMVGSMGVLQGGSYVCWQYPSQVVFAATAELCGNLFTDCLCALVKKLAKQPGLRARHGSRTQYFLNVLGAVGWWLGVL